LNQRYAVLYADPPWDYKGQTQHGGEGVADTGGAAVHYPTLTLADLKRLDVPSVTADDALLFLWTSSPHLDQAVDLLKAWGFQWATVGFVWDKQRVNPGFYTMSQCELCLIGKRGKIPQPRGARNVRQFVSELRGEHSAKPEEVRSRIEAMFPTQTKLELFARTKVASWHAWGNEVQSDVHIGVRP
jgi:N6-adenosine-specific RNA methylase IME4